MRRKPLTAVQRDAESDRRLWATGFRRCFACGAFLFNGPADVHEIIRRSETNDWRDKRNYTLLCRECHEEAHGGWLTKGVLATLKMLIDPENYDIEWLRASGVRHGIECEPLPDECQWLLSERRLL